MYVDQFPIFSPSIQNQNYFQYTYNLFDMKKLIKCAQNIYHIQELISFPVYVMVIKPP